MDRQEAQDRLRELYRCIWKSWYSDQQQLSPAELELKMSDASSVYAISDDKITINLPEGTVDEFRREDDPFSTIVHRDLLEWPPWGHDLIEEMLHEYQNKVIRRRQTGTSKALWEKYGTKFDGAGHGPDFFAAIEEVAPHLEMTPEELARRLAGPSTKDVVRTHLPSDRG